MNFDPAMLSERLWPWATNNWEWLVAGAIILAFAIAIRRLFNRAGSRRAAAKTVMQASDRPDTQSLDVATAAAAEISADIEAYARALYTEDMVLQAERAVANAPQSLRFATIAEAPFVYDGVIMRDVSLLPTSLIAPVSNHFRHAQHILDALRRQGMLTAAENGADERVAGLRNVAQALAQGLDKATHAAEKLDQWLVKNGGAFEPPRGLAELPIPALSGVVLDRVGQRSKAWRSLREQARARLLDIEGLIETARRSRAETAATIVMAAQATPSRAVPPSPPPAPSPRQLAPELSGVLKPEDKRAAE